MSERALERRIYYRLELVVESALSIGGADSTLTDCDVVLDSEERPCIPATSLCGALRAGLDDADARAVFGDLSGSRSSLRVYDACLRNEDDCFVSIRDNVSLDERVAVPGLKFDREVVNKGARFIALLEVVKDHEFACAMLERVLCDLDCGRIRLGAKKTRGLGRVCIASGLVASFDLVDGGIDAWLDFDPFADKDWESGEYERFIEPMGITRDETGRDEALIELKLELVGGVSVREYTTEPDSYDYSQMVIPGVKSTDRNNQRVEAPVIPGTSWAGAIREQYDLLAGAGDRTDRLFGTVRGPHPHPSRIVFDESILQGGEWRVYTRNAIDRFTGGTIPRALFTQRSYHGGSTTLAMRIGLTYLELDDDGNKVTRELEAEDVMPLVAALADLHNGLIAVGGLASVGHGLFRIQEAHLKVRGDDLSDAFAGAFMVKDEKDESLVVPRVKRASELVLGIRGEDE